MIRFESYRLIQMIRPIKKSSNAKEIWPPIILKPKFFTDQSDAFILEFCFGKFSTFPAVNPFLLF